MGLTRLLVLSEGSVVPSQDTTAIEAKNDVVH